MLRLFCTDLDRQLARTKGSLVEGAVRCIGPGESGTRLFDISIRLSPTPSATCSATSLRQHIVGEAVVRLCQSNHHTVFFMSTVMMSMSHMNGTPMTSTSTATMTPPRLFLSRLRQMR